MPLIVRRPGRQEFAQAAASILSPAFPEYDVPGKGGFLDEFDSGSYDVLAAFDADLAGEDPVGLVLADDGAHPDVRLIAFFAVNQKFRGHGVGSALLTAAVDKLEEDSPRLILIEVEDPRVHEPTPGTGDPSARLRFYRRHGAGRIDVSYAEPVFDDRIEQTEGMLLFAIGGSALRKANETREPVSVGGHLSEFLTGYVNASAERRDAEGHYRPEIERMLAEAPSASVYPSKS